MYGVERGAVDTRLWRAAIDMAQRCCLHVRFFSSVYHATLSVVVVGLALCLSSSADSQTVVSAVDVSSRGLALVEDNTSDILENMRASMVSGDDEVT